MAALSPVKLNIVEILDNLKRKPRKCHFRPTFRSRREESLGFGCPSVGVEGPVFNSQDADWLRRVHDVLQARQPQKISFVASLFREPATLQRKTQN